MKPSDAFLIDRRVAQRHIDRGLLSQQYFDKSLSGLADVAGQSVMTSIPIVKVTARKSVAPKVTSANPAEDNLYDLDEDDDGDDD